MKVTMLLADFVQVHDNKLTAVGAGWNITPGEEHSIPCGVGLIFWVPWDRANHPQRFSLSLLTEDGDQVMVGEPGAGGPLRIEDTFEVGRPPGVKPGSALSVALAINVGPLHLPYDTGFVWRLEIPDAGCVEECNFRTSPAPPQVR